MTLYVKEWPGAQLEVYLCLRVQRIDRESLKLKPNYFDLFWISCTFAVHLYISVDGNNIEPVENGGCSIVRRFDSPKVRRLALGLGLEMYLVGLSD